MLGKPFAGFNKKSTKIITVLLFITLLALVAATAPAAKATGAMKINFNPAEAAVGATVQITGSGFSPDEPVTFVCTNQMFSPSITTDDSGNIAGSCTVPDFPAGTYHVVVNDAFLGSVSATFVVTGGGTSTASPSSSPSPTSSTSGNGNGNSYTTYSPTSTSSNGFWSPTVIGIIVAVLIAFAISGVLLYSRQGKQRMMLERERERDRDRTSYGPESPQGPYGPGPGAQPSGYGYSPQPSSYGPAPSSPAGSSRYTPYNYRSQSSSSSYQSRYNQASSYRPSAYASRYSQPSSYRQPQSQSSYSRPAMHSKTCSHCKRSVREDQNICPYCNKRV